MMKQSTLDPGTMPMSLLSRLVVVAEPIYINTRPLEFNTLWARFQTQHEREWRTTHAALAAHAAASSPASQPGGLTHGEADLLDDPASGERQDAQQGPASDVQSLTRDLSPAALADFFVALDANVRRLEDSGRWRAGQEEQQRATMRGPQSPGDD